VSLIAITIILLRPNEPTDQGKRLSAWLEDLDYGLTTFKNSAAAEAQTAVLRIGSNGVPTLIRMMRCKDSTSRIKLVAWLSSQKLVHIKFRAPAEHIQWRGARGIYLLGPQGKAAVPDLINLLSHRSSWVRSTAASALGKIGPAVNHTVVPELVKALEDPVPDVRNCACFALQNIGPAARAAIPALVKHVDDPDKQTRSVALGCWFSLSDDPASLVPRLIERLNDPSPDMRGTVLNLLSDLRTNAHAALPAVTKTLEDSDKDVRRAATNTLGRIAGSEAAKATPPDGGLVFKFVNIQVTEILKSYQQMANRELLIAKEVQRHDVPVTIKPLRGLTKEEALKLIEDELSQQAGIVIDRPANGPIVVTYDAKARQPLSPGPK